MKRREFLKNISLFFRGLLCFLLPSFCILFISPLSLLTSQVIAWDCSAPESLSVCTLSSSLTKFFLRKVEDMEIRCTSAVILPKLFFTAKLRGFYEGIPFHWAFLHGTFTLRSAGCPQSVSS
jgi:hypothetical protein